MTFSCTAKETESHSSRQIELMQSKNCQTIQKQRTRGEKEVEQEVRNNLGVTLLSQTPLTSSGKMMTCRYILHAWVFSIIHVWIVGD